MKRKAIICVILAASLLSGCSIKSTGGSTAESSAEGSAEATSETAGTENASETAEAQGTAEAVSILNADIPGDTVIASPTNGAEGMDITFGDFLKEYKYYLWQYGVTDDTDDSMQSVRQNIINEIVKDRIIRAEFSAYGLSFTDEEKEEIQASTDNGIDQIISAIKQVVSEAGSTLSDDELTEQATTYFESKIADCGITRDDMYGWQELSSMIEKLTEYLGSEADIAYEEAESQMQEAVASLKELYETDPASYSGQYYTSIWEPEGTREIQAILIGFEYEDYSEITVLRSSGSEEAANEMRESKLDTIEERYNALMEKVNAGEDFEQLMTDNNDDGGNGVFIVTPGTEIYGQDFYDSAMGLESVGDVTSLLMDYGWYIIRYKGDSEVTEEELKETTETLWKNLISNEKTEIYDAEYEKWAAEYNYTIDNERLMIDSEQAATTEQAAATTEG